MNRLMFKFILVGLLAITYMCAQISRAEKAPIEVLSTVDMDQLDDQQSSLLNDYNLPDHPMDLSVTVDQPEPSKGSLLSDYFLE